MNTEYLQGLRYKLQKRVRRLHSSTVSVFHANLNNVWIFLHSHAIFVGLLDDLRSRHPQLQQEVAKLRLDHAYLGNTEDEHAALACFVIESCLKGDTNAEALIGRYYSNRNVSEFSDHQATFFAVFVEPLYEYIDEHIDDQRAILALLRRYKHKCEWFQRTQLRDLLGKGEKELARHLYEYLFDQGIQFNIESASASGEADLIAAQNSDDPLILDVKIFEPANSKNKTYILKGFNQVYTYTLDYNEPFGYMVVFNNSGKDLAFPSANIEQSTPLFTHNNKTIFILIVDIFDHLLTASKRGNLETVTISEEELIRVIEAQE